MFPCSQCKKKFKYKSELVRHEQSHTKQFECSLCDKKFNFESARNRHENQHIRTGNVSCDKCGRTFRDNALLKRHMEYAHDGTQVCEICKSIFQSLTALQSHLRTHKPESERRFRCQFDGCGKTFNFSHHLKNHEFTHTNTKKYFCKFCGKGFIQGHHLKVHSKTHESKWFYCDKYGCGKKFLTSIAKEKHSATHKTSIVNVSATILPFDIKVHANNLIISKLDPPHEWKDKLIGNTPTETSTMLNNNTCKPILNTITLNTNTDENCLCSQMSSNNSQNLLEVPFLAKDKNCDINELITDHKNDICGNCDCSKSYMKINVCNRSKTLPDDTATLDTSAVVYQSDGIIMLKETFDKNIEIQDRLQEDFYDSHIPLNSCKAALGKCIVSGNATMGEECLCAKMSDQNVHSEEIDALTLLPVQFN